MKSRIHIAMALAVTLAAFVASTPLSMRGQIGVGKSINNTSKLGRLVAPQAGPGPVCPGTTECVK